MQQAGLVGSALLLVAFAVAAQSARAGAWKAGLLIGAVQALWSDVIMSAFAAGAPAQSAGFSVSTTLLPGYWIAAAGLLLALAAGVLRLASGRSRRADRPGPPPAGGPAASAAEPVTG